MNGFCTSGIAASPSASTTPMPLHDRICAHSRETDLRQVPLPSVWSIAMISTIHSSRGITAAPGCECSPMMLPSTLVASATLSQRKKIHANAYHLLRSGVRSPSPDLRHNESRPNNRACNQLREKTDIQCNVNKRCLGFDFASKDIQNVADGVKRIKADAYRKYDVQDRQAGRESEIGEGRNDVGHEEI